MASQEGEAEDGNGGVLTLDAAVSEAVAEIGRVPKEVRISELFFIVELLITPQSPSTKPSDDRGASFSVRDARRR